MHVYDQECLLGKFLDSRSKHEGTEAGKMMSYIGYAEDYMSKKRNTLYPSVNRLMTVMFSNSRLIGLEVHSFMISFVSRISGFFNRKLCKIAV